MAPKAKAAPVEKKAAPAQKKVAPAEEPKAKKAKTEEPPKKEEPQQEETDKESEKDAPADKRPTIKEKVSFNTMDTTLNVLPTFGGKVLMSLSDGGMQFLIAGAKANVGMKAGRYMFECKVVEALTPEENPSNRGKVPLPRQLLRVGLSLAGSSLILGEDDMSVCFDAEGSFTSMKKINKGVTQRVGRDQTLAVLVNLDEKSPNYHTVSLFKNKERVCEPQKLPEEWKGKTLFPHVSYRNISVQVNFGPTPLEPLPFTCKTLGAAAQADVEVVKPPVQKDGKYEVLFPVAFPDEGTFDWLDTYKEKNPQYCELSDRMIVDWAAKSGLTKPRPYGGSKASGDRHEFNYGLSTMDDLSVRRVLNVVAPMVPRNYIVMEVKENLLESDRKVNLKRFSNPAYKKVAHVVMGEPNDDFKKVIQSRILKEKQSKAEGEWKARKAEKERKKAVAARQKQLEAMKKAAEEKKKKAAEDAKKAAEEKKKAAAEAAAKKKAEAEAKKKAEEAKKKAEEEGGEAAEEEEKKEGEEEPKKEEEKEETKDEAEKKDEKEEDDKKEDDKKEDDKKEEEEKKEVEKKEEEEEKKEEEPEEEDEPMPEVELTEEDKKVFFRPSAVPDLTPTVLSQSFGKFTLPQKDEGFDNIVYEWQGAEKANDYLRSWVLNKKLTAPIDDLKPSAWFKEKNTKFVKQIKEWQEKQKPLEKKKAEEAKKAAAKAAKDEDITEDDVAEDLDIFAVEDINDVGNGEPLYISFTFEDWALLNLRYEMVLLAFAFKHDVDDEDYIGIHEPNLAFYYQKYFGKVLNTKHYGKDSNKDLLDLIKDCAAIDSEKNVLKASIEDQDTLDLFVKLTEEGRRERQRRVDAGDETARLKFAVALKNVGSMTAAKPGGAKAVGPIGSKPGGIAKPVGSVGAAGLRPPAGTGLARPVFGKGPAK